MAFSSSGGRKLKFLVSGLILGLMEACSPAAGGYGESLDRGQDALRVAREEAQLNFTCPGMKADHRVGKMHEGDAQGGLFSEYLVRVSGCGKSAEYRVSCREGGLCSIEE